MQATLNSLELELHEKYKDVLQLHHDGKSVYPLLKEMWLIAEQIESKTHHSFLMAQNLASLLRNHINANEAGTTYRVDKSFDDIVEDALRHQHKKNYLNEDDPDTLRFRDLKTAIDSLNISKGNCG